ncbi:DUF397 domain-containing protein [Streptomyces sp. NPDC048211]|uniref:DUF397 domain-containing protein n=1 Tax=Streptomyces sp. NPDC048211 TaxID=3365516 RepID=UPI000A3DCB6F
MKLSGSDYDLSTAVWRKSTYSDGSGGNCLEVLDGVPEALPVRDSKVTDGPVLVFRTGAWSTFVAGLKRS